MDTTDLQGVQKPLTPALSPPAVVPSPHLHSSACAHPYKTSLPQPLALDQDIGYRIVDAYRGEGGGGFHVEEDPDIERVFPLSLFSTSTSSYFDYPDQNDTSTRSHSLVTTPTASSPAYSTPADTSPVARGIHAELTGPFMNESFLDIEMVKDRRSLQSLFVPSFLQSPPAARPVQESNQPTRSHGSPISPIASGSPVRTPKDILPAVTGMKRRKRAQTHTGGTPTVNTSIANLLSVDTGVIPPTIPVVPDVGNAEANGRLSPSAFLLDDDPFANLTSPASAPAPPPKFTKPNYAPETGASSTPLIPPSPPSPLNPVARPTSRSTPTSPSTYEFERSGRPTTRSQIPTHSIPSKSTTAVYSPPRTTPQQSTRPVSPPSVPQHPHARPAHTRPAFTPRPSLPSLSTLARMDMPISTFSNMLGMSVKMKKRKGRVGAGLPLEPWDTPSPVVSPAQSPSAESTGFSVSDMDAHIASHEVNAASSSSIDVFERPPLDLPRISESPEEDHLHATITELDEGERGGGGDCEEQRPLPTPVTPALNQSTMPNCEPKTLQPPDAEATIFGDLPLVDVADANVNENASASHRQHRQSSSFTAGSSTVGDEEVGNEADISVQDCARHDDALLTVAPATSASLPSLSPKPINIARSRKARSTPSPSYSPLMTPEELGVYLSSSPSFPNALRTQTRPDSLTIDPQFLVDRLQARLQAVAGGSGLVSTDTSDILVIQPNEKQPEAEIFPAEQPEKVEDDGSSLPPLSTPAEFDPVFSLSPSRERSLSESSSYRIRTSHSRSHSPESEDRSFYGNDATRPPSFDSVQGEMPGYSRLVSESSFDSSLDELSLTLYETSPFDSFDNTVVSEEGPFAPRASRLSDLSLELDKAFSFERMVGWKPYDEKSAGFEPGSSTGTLRPSVVAPAHSGRAVSDGDSLEVWLGHTSADLDISSSAAMDHARAYAGGYSNGRGGVGSGYNGSTGTDQLNGYSQSTGQDSSESDYGEGRGSGRWNGGRGQDGRDGPGDRSRGSALSTPASTADSSGEETSSSDNYGADGNAASVGARDHRRNGQKGVLLPQDQQRPTSQTDDSDDDNVPLAQRLPHALDAQKSIRRQQRDERRRKRAERSATANAQSSYVAADTERGRTMTLRPPMSASWAISGTMSSSQEAAVLAQRSMQPAPVEGTTRTRARTIGHASGVAPDDLARRLLKVQQQEFAQVDASHPPSSPSTTRMPSLRTDSSETVRGLPGTLERSATMAAPRHGEYETIHTRRNRTPAPSSREPAPSLRPMRSFHGTISPVSSSVVPPLPVRSPQEGHAPQSYFTRPSSHSRRSDDANVMMEQERSRNVRSARPSFDASRPPRNQRVSADEGIMPPPVPPLPSTSKTPQQASPPSGATLRLSHPSNTSQLRIFIGDLQRFNMVEVGPDTSANDVLIMIEKQGEISRDSGGWMVFEICQDFGLERPIRNYEHLLDVSSSWDKDKSLNMFMVKKTYLAAPLSTIPSGSPRFSGPVEWEVKKGKWSKRWLELREHGLFVSKREGKGEEFLCSLSTFDAYVGSRIQKAPKPFVFAVKSTDPIALFENKSDYLHIFCCSEEGGRKWMENILLAKSYVLYQEKHVLFPRKESDGAAPLHNSGSISRSGTRKRSKSLAQPHVNSIPAFIPPLPIGHVQPSFEPGSLLARRTTDASR